MGMNRYASNQLIDQNRGWDENTQTWTYKKVAAPPKPDDCDLETAAVTGMIIHELLDGD